MKELEIIDIGSRFGIHPSNKTLTSLAQHILIECDADECKRLELKYKQFPNIKIFNKFFNKKKNIDFYIYSHPGGSSSLKPDPQRLYWTQFRKNTSNIKQKIKMSGIGLDEFVYKHNINPSFLKVDVEGSEVELLQSGKKTLQNKILGARIEVELNSLYFNHNASFNEVCKILDAAGFEFMNFDLFSNSFTPFSDYYNTETYGQLIGCDAIFMKSPKDFKKLSEDDMIFYIIFCLNNNLQDLAIYLLTTVISKKKIVEKLKIKNPELFNFIENEVAKLFFSLRDRQRFDLEHFKSIWTTIFGKKNKWVKHGDFFSRFSP